MGLSSEELFLSNLRQIEDLVDFVCRRHRLSTAEREDFGSHVKLKLIEDDYAVIRKHRGESTLATYLSAVVHHLFLDYRASLWGKWRPSAAAKRLGPVAIRLETLIARDGLSFEEAFETLRTNHSVAESRAALTAMAAAFPPRTRRLFVGEEAASELAADPYVAEQRAIENEARPVARRASDVIRRRLSALSARDRLMLRMRYRDSFTVAEIAQALHLAPKPLYRRFEELLRQLRADLVASGIDADSAHALLDRGALDLDVNFGSESVSSFQEGGAGAMNGT